jgi:drug/metabolite transporter (DMT)-like permease
MLIIYALLIVMIIIWSFSFVLVDIALEFIPPMSIALTRFLIVSLVFIIVDLYSFINRKRQVDRLMNTTRTR